MNQINNLAQKKKKIVLFFTLLWLYGLSYLNPSVNSCTGLKAHNYFLDRLWTGPSLIAIDLIDLIQFFKARLWSIASPIC